MCRHKNVFDCAVFWTALYQFTDFLLECWGQPARGLDWVPDPVLRGQKPSEDDDEETDGEEEGMEEEEGMQPAPPKPLKPHCKNLVRMGDGSHLIMCSDNVLYCLQLFHNGNPEAGLTPQVMLAFIHVEQKKCEEAHIAKAHHGRKAITIKHRWGTTSGKG